MSTADRVKAILVDHLGAKESDITTFASIVDDLGADSLDLVELIMAAEVEFDIEVSDDDAEALLTVGDAVKYFDRRTSEQLPMSQRLR